MRTCVKTLISALAVTSRPTSAIYSPATALGVPVPGLLEALFGINYNSGDGGIDQYRQRDDTYALFTNDTYHVTSKFEINLGLRYT